MKMHCSDEQLINLVDNKAKRHFKQCNKCQQRYWQLKRLQHDATSLPLYQPNPNAWDKVKANIELAPVKQKRPTHIWRIAAGFLVGCVVSLASYHSWQVKQLEEVIAASSKLEREFQLTGYSLINQDDKLWRLAEIDERLNRTDSRTAQKDLWQKRNELLLQLIAQSNQNVESI